MTGGSGDGVGAPWRDVATPLAATCALVLGIAAGEREPRLLVLTAPGVVMLALAWFTRSRAGAVLVVLGAAALGAGGGARAAGELRWPAATPRPTGLAVVDGTVRGDPYGHPFATRLVVDASRLDGQPFDRRLEVRAADRASLRLRALQLGDSVRLEGVVVALGPDDEGARTRRVVAFLAGARLVSFTPSSSVHLRVADRVRGVVERGARRLPAGDRSLLLGFLLGDTRDLDPTTTEQFRAAGLSHLLAVSGANVAFVLALASPMLRRLPVVARAAGGATVVVVFAAATRFEPSVLRASAMAAVVMVARLLGRKVAAGRALALAVCALLAHDPLLVHSLGFRLSVAATAGIVAFASGFGRALRGPAPLRDALGVTLAAELAVAPLLAAELGGVPAIAPVANVLVVPVAEPLTLYGLVATAVAGVLPTRLGEVLLLPCSLLLQWARNVARASAAVHWQLNTGALVVLGVLVASVAVAHLARGRPR